MLSWNLEGLAEDELDARTRVAMTEVLGLSPTIACFQEVVPRSLATVQRCLHAVYEDAERESPPSGSYFTKLYIRRGSGLTVTDVVRLPFRAGSAMGRDLVRVTLAGGCGTHVCVATTHLESTAQQVAVRLMQFRESLQNLTSQAATCGAALEILVGDLNMGFADDRQHPSAKDIAKGWTDAMLHSGPTWDCGKNTRAHNLVAKANVKCRFDRCYFRQAACTRASGGWGGAGWKFEGGALVGTTRSGELRHSFASDHWGLLLRWQHPSGFGSHQGGSASSFPVHSGGGAARGGGSCLGAVMGGCRALAREHLNLLRVHRGAAPPPLRPPVRMWRLRRVGMETAG